MFLLTEHPVIALASYTKKRVPDLFTNRCIVDFDGTEHRETFWYICNDFLIWFFSQIRVFIIKVICITLFCLCARKNNLSLFVALYFCSRSRNDNLGLLYTKYKFNVCTDHVTVLRLCSLTLRLAVRPTVSFLRCCQSGRVWLDSAFQWIPRTFGRVGRYLWHIHSWRE
jgi:hypothetical protein